MKVMKFVVLIVLISLFILLRYVVVRKVNGNAKILIVLTSLNYVIHNHNAKMDPMKVKMNVVLKNSQNIHLKHVGVSQQN